MKKGDSEVKKGFTIIEVSLVLAIAGLIFLMTFVALPALRASQRDTSRKEGMTLLIDAVKDYQSNNRGALPDKWGADSNFNKYLAQNNNFAEPNTGERYVVTSTPCGDGVATGADCLEVTREGGMYTSTFEQMQGTMMVVTRATCGDDNHAVATSNPRRVAVLMHLERGGVYCVNS